MQDRRGDHTWRSPRRQRRSHLDAAVQISMRPTRVLRGIRVAAARARAVDAALRARSPHSGSRHYLLSLVTAVTRRSLPAVALPTWSLDSSHDHCRCRPREPAQEDRPLRDRMGPAPAPVSHVPDDRRNRRTHQSECPPLSLRRAATCSSRRAIWTGPSDWLIARLMDQLCG